MKLSNQVASWAIYVVMQRAYQQYMVCDCDVSSDYTVFTKYQYSVERWDAHSLYLLPVIGQLVYCQWDNYVIGQVVYRQWDSCVIGQLVYRQWDY